VTKNAKEILMVNQMPKIANKIKKLHAFQRHLGAGNRTNSVNIIQAKSSRSGKGKLYISKEKYGYQD
jgi:hypothetical protein